MKLEKEQIEHIANLARLELTEAEKAKYGNQLSGILDYIEQLQEVNTENIEPTAQVTGLVNVFREDEIIDCLSDEKDLILEQAPEFEDGQVKVMRIL